MILPPGHENIYSVLFVNVSDFQSVAGFSARAGEKLVTDKVLAAPSVFPHFPVFPSGAKVSKTPKVINQSPSRAQATGRYPDKYRYNSLVNF